MGVGVGRRGRTETFLECHTGLIPDDQVAYLWLLFLADALTRDSAGRPIQGERPPNQQLMTQAPSREEQGALSLYDPRAQGVGDGHPQDVPQRRIGSQRHEQHRRHQHDRKLQRREKVVDSEPCPAGPSPRNVSRCGSGNPEGFPGYGSTARRSRNQIGGRLRRERSAFSGQLVVLGASRLGPILSVRRPNSSPRCLF